MLLLKFCASNQFWACLSCQPHHCGTLVAEATDEVWKTCGDTFKGFYKSLIVNVPIKLHTLRSNIFSAKPSDLDVGELECYIVHLGYRGTGLLHSKLDLGRSRPRVEFLGQRNLTVEQCSN